MMTKKAMEKNLETCQIVLSRKLTKMKRATVPLLKMKMMATNAKCPLNSTLHLLSLIKSKTHLETSI